MPGRLGPRTQRFRSIVAAAALGWGAVGSGAIAALGDNGGLPVTIEELVGTLHRVNQLEIEAGKMARHRGTEAVRTYGETLEQHHRRADEQLKSYAAKHDLALDAPPPARIGAALAFGESELENLTNLGGVAFDGEFAQMMVRDQQTALALVDQARDDVRDPELRAVLGRLEPVLRDQRQRASTLLQAHNAGTLRAEPDTRPASH